jgi:hypothetical protein
VGADEAGLWYYPTGTGATVRGVWKEVDVCYSGVWILDVVPYDGSVSWEIRSWTCADMVFSGRNTATILVGRFLIGAMGSVGATLVGGTISDIYVPAKSVLDDKLESALIRLDVASHHPCSLSVRLVAED